MRSVIKIVGGGLAAAGVVGGVAFANTGAFDDHTKRDSSSAIVESGGLGAFKVQVGDCVTWPDGLDTDRAEPQKVTSVQGVPCDQPHDAQAYASFDVTLPHFDADAVMGEATSGCATRWTDAIGTNLFGDVDHDATAFTPSEQSWKQGHDREVVCFVISVDGSPLVGSLLHPAAASA
jgi:hypothetical protein